MRFVFLHLKHCIFPCFVWGFNAYAHYHLPELRSILSPLTPAKIFKRKKEREKEKEKKKEGRKENEKIEGKRKKTNTKEITYS